MTDALPPSSSVGVSTGWGVLSEPNVTEPPRAASLSGAPLSLTVGQSPTFLAASEVALAPDFAVLEAEVAVALALLFGACDLLFAVEAVFLFPWALVFDRPGFGATTVVEMGVFVAIVALGILYAWRRGVLRWT